MIYHYIYKIGGLYLNMKYIVMIHETQIKYTLMKLNMPFHINVSGILCHFYQTTYLK